MTSPFDDRPNAPSVCSNPYRSSWRRVAVSSIFWLGLTALSVVMVAALGAMAAAMG